MSKAIKLRLKFKAMFKIIRKEFQNTVCQWVEIYKNGEYMTRMLVGGTGTKWEQSDKQIVDEYFNSLAIDRMF